VVLAMVIASAALNTLVVAGQLRRVRLDRVTLKVSFALAVCTVGGNLAVLYALHTLHPAIVSVTTHIQVLFVVALAWPLLGERPSARFAVGTLIALGGFVLMRVGELGDGTVTTIGLLWGLLASTMWAVMAVITRRYAMVIRPVVVNSLRLWLAAIALACMPGVATSLTASSPRVWLYAAAAGLAGPVLSRVTLMYSLRYATASTVTLIGLVGPVMAFALGLLAFGTMPGTIELLGGVIVVSGVALPIWRAVRREPAAMQRRG
jgi:probable blue pigment (indigoidine) exporter